MTIASLNRPSIVPAHIPRAERDDSVTPTVTVVVRVVPETLLGVDGADTLNGQGSQDSLAGNERVGMPVPGDGSAFLPRTFGAAREREPTDHRVPHPAFGHLLPGGEGMNWCHSERSRPRFLPTCRGGGPLLRYAPFRGRNRERNVLCGLGSERSEDTLAAAIFWEPTWILCVQECCWPKATEPLKEHRG